MLINDEFVGTPRAGVEVVEVFSEGEPRKFVLVHPEHYGLDTLGVKTHFVWSCLDGVKTLAQVKQDYYNKFKVLPTQQVLEFVRSWLNRGFLMEKQALSTKGERASLTGWWGIPLPALLIRGSIGAFTAWFVHKIMVVVCLLLGLGSLAYFVSTKGTMYLHQPFEALPTPMLVMTALVGCYVPYVLMTLLRLGTLFRGHTYKGDRVVLGCWYVFPSLGVGDSGLALNPKHQVLALRGLEWLLPLACSGAFSILAFFVLPDSLKMQALGSSLGSFLFFIFGSCPFVQSHLVKGIEALGSGLSLSELKAAYRQNVEVFESEYGPRAVKQIQLSMASVLIWVVLGSSFLLFTFAKVADGMGAWGKGAMSLGARSSQFWQLLLYAPILLGFFWMLWKLVQPFVERMLQYSIWREERLLSPVLSLLVLCLIPLYQVLPHLLMRCGSGLLIFSLVILHWKERDEKYIQVWKWLSLTLIAMAGLSVLLPEREWLLQWGMSGFWLAWSVWVFFLFSPQVMAWWLKSVGLALGIFVTLAIFSGFEVAPVLLAKLSFSLWFSLTLWTGGGQIGIQCLAGLVASGLYWCGLSFQGGGVPLESIYLSALIATFLSPLGWARAKDRVQHRFAHVLKIHLDHPEKSIKDSLSGMMSLLFGPWIPQDLAKKNASLPKFAKVSRQCLKSWLGREGWSACGRIALSGAEGGQRLSIEDDAGFKVLTPFERRGSLSKEQRTKVLHSQLYFKGFGKPDIERLSEFLSIEEFSHGDLLMRQGQEAHPCLEIVLKGGVVLERLKPGGKFSVLAELGPLEAVKFDDLFSDEPYDFSARCEGQVVTARLYRQHLMAWASEKSGRIEQVLESVNLANMIMNLSLFRDFSPSQVRLLMERLKKVEVKKGKDVITQGDDGDEFFLLDKGEVAIFIHGKEVAKLKTGSYFGEIALLQKCKRTATVRTTENCTLYSLSQKDFDRFFSSGRGAQVLQNVSSSRVGEAES